MSVLGKVIDFKNPDVTKEDLRGCMTTSVNLASNLRYDELAISGVIFTGGASASAVILRLERVGRRVFCTLPQVQAAFVGAASSPAGVIPDGWRPVSNSSGIILGVNNAATSSTFWTCLTAGTLSINNAGTAWSTGTCGTGNSASTLSWESAQ